MEARTRPGALSSRAPRSAAAGRTSVRFAMRWRAAAVLAAAAIAAACQGPAVPKPGPPEGQPTETPTGEHGETPTDPPAGAPAGAPTELPGALPALAIADVSAGEGDRLLRFPVSLAPAATAPVTVAFATEDGTATAGTDYTAVSGTLTFPAASTAARRIAVPVLDDAVAEDQEAFSVRLSDPQGATLTVATATATIVDDDRRSVAVFPAHLNVPEGAAGSYSVVLGAQPTAPVTVTAAAPPAELSIVPATVVFTASDWRTARTVTVSAAEDEDAIADAPVQLTHAAAGGGYDGLATAVTVTIVENDVPTLAVAAARAAEADGPLRFAVSLSLASHLVVSVDWSTAAAGDTASAGADYTAAGGRLSFPAGATDARTIEVVVRDDPLDEPDEDLTVTLRNPVHAELAGSEQTATATGTIENDDPAPELSIAAAGARESDPTIDFPVWLDHPSGRTVTVHYATADATATASADYTAVTGSLTFPAGATTHTIMVPIANDESDEPEEAFTLTLSAAVHATVAARGRSATGTIEDDDPAPELSIADARASESGATINFPVRLDRPSGRTVTVHYATADDTATAGADYTAASGTLTFPTGATTHTITVPIANDESDEPEEAFTLTLSTAVHATVAPLAATATGTIEDDDPAPELTIADAGGSESAGAIAFTVRLDRASGRTVTVDYATADATATAGADYTAVTGSLTFPAGATTHTIIVPLLEDQEVEQDETFTVTLSAARGASLTAPTATATITDATVLPTPDEPLVLTSLEVTGGGDMYPPFDPDIRHYALTCSNPTTLQVTATASRDAATLTLLRADPADQQPSTGSLDVQVTVNGNHDLVVELGDAGDTTRYVVHCLPSNFPKINILEKTLDVSPGLLFVIVSGLAAVIDNNGVARYHFDAPGRNFRPHEDGPVIDDRKVRYSFHRFAGNKIDLLDDHFQTIRNVGTVAGLTAANNHDHYVTEDGTFLFISYQPATRDFSQYEDELGDPYSTMENVIDSVIQEVSVDGDELFRWNSWGNLNLDPDCRLNRFIGNYSQLNSLHVQDGDVVISFRGCSQVLKLDRSSDTWAVEWKLGGTAATPDTSTAYLEIVDDPAGEICGQHQASLTDAGTVVLFDNGIPCLGPRKDKPVFTRIVEYTISAETNQALFLREYRRPEGHGYARGQGGVTVLDNGHWLITWGHTLDRTVAVGEMFSISEVDPDALPDASAAVFHMNMTNAAGSATPWTYRVYRAPEDAVEIPLNLP